MSIPFQQLNSIQNWTMGSISAAATWGTLLRDVSIDSSMKDRAKLAAVSTSLTGLTLGLSMSNKDKDFDAMIGPVPLEFVTYFDFAESDSVVKYRAFGGEYFAHQGGDKIAMRVDFLLVGPQKEYVVSLLRALRFLSKSVTRGHQLFNTDESWLFDPYGSKNGAGLWQFKQIKRRKAKSVSTTYIANQPYSPFTFTVPSAARRSLIDWGVDTTGMSDRDLLRNANKVAKRRKAYTETENYISTCPSNNVDPLSIQKVMKTDTILKGFSGEYTVHSDEYYKLQQEGYYQYHYNFPVIIDNFYFPNMWIETLQITHEASDGIDAVKGHLLLRKYVAPRKKRWTANGHNPSAKPAKVEKDDDGKTKAEAMDSWVWLWEEKRSNFNQLFEYTGNAAAGMARAAILEGKKPYQFLNNSALMNAGLKKIQAEITI